MMAVEIENSEPSSSAAYEFEAGIEASTKAVQCVGLTGTVISIFSTHSGISRDKAMPAG